eukprot:6965645-Alexandrium_andersonii.AAC.1
MSGSANTCFEEPKAGKETAKQRQVVATRQTRLRGIRPSARARMCCARAMASRGSRWGLLAGACIHR